MTFSNDCMHVWTFNAFIPQKRSAVRTSTGSSPFPARRAGNAEVVQNFAGKIGTGYVSNGSDVVYYNGSQG